MLIVFSAEVGVWPPPKKNDPKYYTKLHEIEFPVLEIWRSVEYSFITITSKSTDN